METIWKNTGGFVDVTMETIWKNTGGIRWEENIKMDLKEIGVDVISQLRIEITGKPLLTWH